MRLDDYCRAVGRDCRLSMTDRAVMWTMQTYVHRQTGETFVSLATLATDVCADVRTVRRAMRRLEELGVISGRPRVGQSTVYRFPLHPAVMAATPGAGVRGQISTTPGGDDRGGSPQPRSSVAHTPDKSGPNPGHVCPPNRCNHVKEPRDNELDDNVAVAVPASVEGLLRPFAKVMAR